jgi:Leucine-rich repeat (LRR) protein
MYINDNNTTDITVRISDHSSNLSRFGVVGNKMDMRHFKKLIQSGAIANIN